MNWEKTCGLLAALFILFVAGTAAADMHNAPQTQSLKGSFFVAWEAESPQAAPPPRTVPPPRKVEPPREVEPSRRIQQAREVSAPRTVQPLRQVLPPNQTLSPQEKASLIDALLRFSRGDPSALKDIMKYTDKIPRGMFVYAQASGGIGAGVNGLGVKLNLLQAGVKVIKNHDGSVEIEMSGQLGPDAGGDAVFSVSGSGSIKGSAFIKISGDGTKIIIGSKIGAGIAGDAGAKSPGIGVFGKYGIDLSAMGGWELEMSTEKYQNLSPFSRSLLSNPGYAAWLAGRNKNIDLFATVQAGASHGGSTGIHGGGGFGPGGEFEGGVGWQSDGNQIPKGWDRIKLLWINDPWGEDIFLIIVECQDPDKEVLT